MSGIDYRAVFSKKLQYYMNLNGKLQSDLCKDLDLKSTTVSSWCNGLKIPRPETVDALASYFNIKRTDLLEYKEEGEEELNISSEGQKLLRAYNNNSTLKILFDHTMELTEEQAKVLINLVEHMKKT